MEIYKEAKEKQYKELWEKFELSLLQSWEWGEIKKPQWEPKRIIIKDYPVTILTKSTPLLHSKFGYISRGLNSSVLSREFLEELKSYGKQLHLSHLLIDPDIQDTKESQNIFSSQGFKTNGKTIQPNQTNIINLTKSQDELWSDLSSSIRRSVNKSQKLGCEVKSYTNSQEAFETFYQILDTLETRNSFIRFPKSYYYNIWNTLSPLGMSKIFIITKENKPLASYMLCYTKTKAYELYGGVLEEGKDLKAGPLLKWSTIEDAKHMGLKLYDQWGVAPMITDNQYDKKDELFYISIFKSRFGGNYYEFLPQQIYIFDKLGYSASRVLDKLNKTILKVRKALK